MLFGVRVIVFIVCCIFFLSYLGEILCEIGKDVVNGINMMLLYLFFISIIIIVKVFLWFVFGVIFLNFMLVKLVRVKYIEVRYFVLRFGLFEGSDWLIGMLIFFVKVVS